MTFIISSSSLSIKTKGDSDIIDITDPVTQKVTESGITDGQALVFVPHSTAAITTIEFESGVVQDLKDAIERIAPKAIPYKHDAKWGDGNGFAHVRAALLKPSLTIPIVNGRLILGTWQQIILIDFDNRPRERKVIVQVSGI